MSSANPPPPPGYPPGPPPGWQGSPPGGPSPPPSSGYPYPGPPPMPPPGFGPPLASFGARLVGSLVDGLITMLFLVPAIVAFVAGPWDTDTCVVDGRFTTCDTPAGETVALGLFLGLLGLLCGLAYHVLPVASSGATPGRKLAGCRVVDLGTGRPPSKAKALGRYLFASLISGNACYLGHLWMLWDPANQTWHDKVCNTVVVRA